MFLTESFLCLHASFIENTSRASWAWTCGICPGWNPGAQLRQRNSLTWKLPLFTDIKRSLPYCYTYHIYRALRANAKWGRGCEFRLCPLVALDLAPVPLSPTSCAAAQQRWVTTLVNDKSRLSVGLEHTEVHRTSRHLPQDEHTAAVACVCM